MDLQIKKKEEEKASPVKNRCSTDNAKYKLRIGPVKNCSGRSHLSDKVGTYRVSLWVCELRPKSGKGHFLLY